MSITYKLLVAMIRAKKTTGILKKADVAYFNGRISEEEYKKIVSMVKADEDDE